MNIGEEVCSEVASQIADSLGSASKFRAFILEYLPPAPSKRPPEWCQHPWNVIDLRKTLAVIYRYRSNALHDGMPFPAPMCEAPYRPLEFEAPAERPFFHSAAGGGTWLEKDTPMLLHTFEYIARNVLINWSSQTSRGSQDI